MDDREKEAIYQQMTLILKEINQLTNNYEDWKNYLFGNSVKQEGISTKLYKKEAEYQQYMKEKFIGNSTNSYQVIATKIAAFLKESGTPLSTKQIFQKLTEQDGLAISYSNLSHNVLRKMHNDNSINVERAYRGYWQYRLKRK